MILRSICVLLWVCMYNVHLIFINIWFGRWFYVFREFAGVIVVGDSGGGDDGAALPVNMHSWSLFNFFFWFSIPNSLGRNIINAIKSITSQVHGCEWTANEIELRNYQQKYTLEHIKRIKNKEESTHTHIDERKI